MNSEDKSLFLKNALLIVGGVAALAAMLLLKVKPESSTEMKFSREVTVNGIQLYGMTYDEAERTVAESERKYFTGIKITCRTGSEDYVLNAADFMSSTIQETMSEAYNACEDNIPVDQSDFYTKYVIDTDKLRAIIKDIADKTDVEAKEPQASFDADRRSFSFTEGVSGIKVDIDDSLKNVIAAVENGSSDVIELKTDIVYPVHTAEELRENTVKIAEYSSVTTNNYNRNRNIELMCSYVNGYCIKPGEILSINGLVGERTPEKGFMAAPAIMDGKRTVDDIGGGICQLSGTLYNAALLANMKITERWAHSWPSDYLEIGLDSTLDWNTQKDLKIQNPTEYDMYISAWLEKKDLNSSNILRVAVYGKPFPDGVTVKVHSEITETTLPEPTAVTYTSSLSPGQSRTVIKARTGYRTRVWREFYCNGELLDSEIVSYSVYSPIRGEIQVGRGTAGASSGSSPEHEPTASPTKEPQETSEPIVIEPPEEPNPTDPPSEG